MAQTMAAMLTERGIERGIERGRTEGIEIGKTEEKQAGILRIIRFRFRMPLPLEDITARVQSITDLDRLDTLFESALTAANFDDIDWQDSNG